MKKVTGIGGIFFKCADPKKMNKWYEKHLGIPVADYGTMFQWRELDNPEKEGYTVWSTFPADTKVKIIDEITASEYGKFVHILDPEGNSIELFEPPA
jgi:lactoylglutathione lyase